MAIPYPDRLTRTEPGVLFFLDPAGDQSVVVLLPLLLLLQLLYQNRVPLLFLLLLARGLKGKHKGKNLQLQIHMQQQNRRSPPPFFRVLILYISIIHMYHFLVTVKVLDGLLGTVDLVIIPLGGYIEVVERERPEGSEEPTVDVVPDLAGMEGLGCLNQGVHHLLTGS